MDDMGENHHCFSVSAPHGPTQIAIQVNPPDRLSLLPEHGPRINRDSLRT